MERVKTIPMTETFDEIEPLVHKICKGFCIQKGIPPSEYEEWAAEAVLAFVEAFHSFDPGRGAKFSTWVWNRISIALAEKYRQEVFHRKMDRLDWRKIKDDNRGCHVFDRIGDGFDFSALSPDARTVVDMVMSIAGHEDGEKKDPPDIRLAIHDLLSAMGWSWKRIVESFQEIGRALT